MKNTAITCRQRFWILMLPIQLVVFFILDFVPEWVEGWYSRGFYASFSWLLRILFNWFPYSLGQLIFYLFIGSIGIYLTRSAFRFFTKEKSIVNIGKEVLLKTLAFVSPLYLAFMVFWGLNYKREKLADTMQLPAVNYEYQALVNLSEKLVKEVNELSDTMKLVDRETKEIKLYEQLAINGYRRAANEWSWLGCEKQRVKPVVIPQLMSLAGISGIYFPFTGEANVNADIPLPGLPFTMAHEMAHQLGYGPEDEANFIAYLCCTKSRNVILRYSGKYMAMRYVLGNLRQVDSVATKSLLSRLDSNVIIDLQTDRAYWRQYQSPMYKISGWINDAFIKANGQAHGEESYERMVYLLMAYEAQTGLSENYETTVK